MLSFKYTSGVRKHKKTIVSYGWAKNQARELLLISSTNIDGFYTFFYC